MVTAVREAISRARVTAIQAVATTAARSTADFVSSRGAGVGRVAGAGSLGRISTSP
jgi:hypothetical protein